MGILALRYAPFAKSSETWNIPQSNCRKETAIAQIIRGRVINAIVVESKPAYAFGLTIPRPKRAICNAMGATPIIKQTCVISLLIAW